MSRSVHFSSKSISGYGSPDGRCLPCSGISGRAMGISPKIVSDVNFLSLRCVSMHTSSVCNATSSNYYRRNQDYSRQNKHGFSRHRNRHNEDRDNSYEDLEESENLSSKNESLLSVSAYQKFQAAPGPREKEIVELFRKVQTQLRERAAMKEERKDEYSHEKSKESETVDSLLKLLRKHSVQQGRKSTNIANNKDFILDRPEQVGPGSSTEMVKSDDIQESPSPHLSRPKSNFRKRSPVPEIKFQPVYSEGSVNSVSIDNLDGGRESDESNEVMIESDVGPTFSEGNVRDEMPEDETSEIHESEHDDGAEEQDVAETADLSGMKLTELRALAKSRGMKGFSKLKKSDLVELLHGSSI